MAKEAKQAQIALPLEPIADGPEFDKTPVSCVYSCVHTGGGWSTIQVAHSSSQYK